jgi:hypothetical protein
MCQCCAETTILDRQMRDRSLHSQMLLSECTLGGHLAVPRREALVLTDGLGERTLVVRTGWDIEGQQPATLRPAFAHDPDRDP